MLKRLAIPALLLALTSIAGWGSEATSQAKTNRQTQGGGSQQQSDDTNDPVRITKFPAVSVTKDWRDDWALAFSGILVLIGLGGVWYARNTLGIIKGQLQEIRAAGLQTDKIIGHAASQAAATAVAAAAAEKAANLALTSAQSYQAAERAWMAHTEVVVSIFTNSTFGDSPEKTDGTKFQMRWINAGNTPAIKCSFVTMHEVLTDKISALPTFTPPQNLEQVYAPIIPRVPVNAPPIYFRRGVIEALKRRECRIFVYGRADYQAVYPTATAPHTEICFEVEYAGVNSKSGETIFAFRVAGPQNSAT